MIRFCNTLKALFCLSIITLFFSCQQADRVEIYVARWDYFEFGVKTEKTFDNPFTDVTLEVVYISPSGKKTTAQGFYSGGNTWKGRFMPDEVGTWRYEALASDESFGTKGQFECVDSDLPGMISTCEDNPVWFGYKGGEATLLRSFHVGDCFFADTTNVLTGQVWGAPQRERFLDWVVANDYNTLSIASHYLNRVDSGRGIGWNTPDLWNEEKGMPNPAEYDRMEEILDDLAERKIIVYPFAGFLGRKSDYPADPEQQDLYLRYTIARLGPYWNLLFNVGGPEPLLRGKSYMTKAEVNDAARRIKEMDPYGHAISIHNQTNTEDFLEQEWLDYGTLQGPKTTNRRKLYEGTMKRRNPGRALYSQETLWPGNMYHKDEYTPLDIRKNAYVLLMACANINFADMDGNSSSGFSGHPDFDLLHQEWHDIIGQVWDNFESTQYYRTKPAPELVDNGYCLAYQGKYYLVYMEEPGAVNLKLSPGKYQYYWRNAQVWEQKSEVVETSGNELMVSTPEGGDDWMLIVEGK